MPRQLDSDGMEMQVDTLLTHRRWLERLAVSMVKSRAEADDLVQETWIAALGQARPRSVRPWLGGIMRNLARMHRRSEARRSHREAACGHPGRLDEREPALRPDQMLERRQAESRLAEAVVALPEPFRSTVLMRYFEGMPAVEIARVQGVPAGTIRWRQKRALELLRQAMGPGASANRVLAPLVVPWWLPFPGRDVSSAPLSVLGSSLGVGGHLHHAALIAAAVVTTALGATTVDGCGSLGDLPDLAATAPAALAARADRPAATDTPRTESFDIGEHRPGPVDAPLAETPAPPALLSPITDRPTASRPSDARPQRAFAPPAAAADPDSSRPADQPGAPASRGSSAAASAWTDDCARDASGRCVAKHPESSPTGRPLCDSIQRGPRPSTDTDTLTKVAMKSLTTPTSKSRPSRSGWLSGALALTGTALALQAGCALPESLGSSSGETTTEDGDGWCETQVAPDGTICTVCTNPDGSTTNSCASSGPDTGPDGNPGVLDFADVLTEDGQRCTVCIDADGTSSNSCNLEPFECLDVFFPNTGLSCVICADPTGTDLYCSDPEPFDPSQCTEYVEADGTPVPGCYLCEESPGEFV
ncbi:MAG: sigma-70 family RNA polymerase sigma factor, partial [Myxococcota bacterium]